MRKEPKTVEEYKLLLIDKKFGRLTVKRYMGKFDGAQRWECLCDCGKVVSRRTEQFRKDPELLSCQCMRLEKTHKKNTLHGLSKSLEYRSYASMIGRCYFDSYTDHQKYKENGILVCDRWRDSFENFLLDMGLRPSKKHSLDRKDNSKGYSPDNCRWATKKEQSFNRKCTVLLVVDGISDTFTGHCRRTGIHKNTVRQRLKAGTPLGQAFLKQYSGWGSLKELIKDKTG